jgi:hypothetical protein
VQPHVPYLPQGSDPLVRKWAYRELFCYSFEPSVVDEIRQVTNGYYA